MDQDISGFAYAWHNAKAAIGGIIFLMAEIMSWLAEKQKPSRIAVTAKGRVFCQLAHKARFSLFIERRNAGKDLAFEELERGSAAG